MNILQHRHFCSVLFVKFCGSVVMISLSKLIVSHTDLPNLSLTHRVPVKFLNVHKDSHQLGDGHGWMSVIQLDGDLETTRHDVVTLFICHLVIDFTSAN